MAVAEGQTQAEPWQQPRFHLFRLRGDDGIEPGTRSGNPLIFERRQRGRHGRPYGPVGLEMGGSRSGVERERRHVIARRFGKDNLHRVSGKGPIVGFVVERSRLSQQLRNGTPDIDDVDLDESDPGVVFEEMHVRSDHVRRIRDDPVILAEWHLPVPVALAELSENLLIDELLASARVVDGGKECDVRVAAEEIIAAATEHDEFVDTYRRLTLAREKLTCEDDGVSCPGGDGDAVPISRAFSKSSEA